MSVSSVFQNLPKKTRLLIPLSLVLAFTVALPLFVWAVITQQQYFKQKATSETSVCVVSNKKITVTPQGIGTCHDIQTAINSVDGIDYTIEIQPGIYDIYDTVKITDKTNLTITGIVDTNLDDVTIFSKGTGGWGFLIERSSGHIQWLSIKGGSSNGMISIKQSDAFTLDMINAYSQNSHTIDVTSSKNINIYRSNIQSSAGGVEIDNSGNVSLLNNRIHNSTNGLSVFNSSNIYLYNNLFYENREVGLKTNSTQNLRVIKNTFYNNSLSGGFSAVELMGDQDPSSEFSQNIITNNPSSGILSHNNLTFNVFKQNDIWGNNPNYSGYADQTGINLNISQDPMINPSNNIYCPDPNSPVIYGDAENDQYMGAVAPCKPDTSPPPTVRGFQFNVKLAGVNDGRAEGAKVIFGFSSKLLTSPLYTSPVSLYHIGGGIYKALIGVTSDKLPSGNDYSITAKGEKHLGRKFCFQTGQTSKCDPSLGGKITLPPPYHNTLIFDFTNMPLEPGDLQPQDGMTDTQDFSRIKNLMSKPCTNLTDTDKMTGDLDYNGCINITDAFLIRKTLETRYDEY